MDWNNINIIKYERIVEINDSEMEAEEKANALIELAFNVRDPESLPITQYMNLLKQMSFMKEEPKKKDLQIEYVLNGNKYELDVTPSDFTVAQYIDMVEYAKNDAGLIDVLSVVLIPTGHKYNDGYDLQKAKNDISTLGICDALSIQAFFLGCLEKYITISQRFLKRMMKRMMKKGNRQEAEEVNRMIEEFSNISLHILRNV